MAEDPKAWKPKFNPGPFYYTPGVMEAVPTAVLLVLLTRHMSGDWGDMCEEDKQTNDQALQHGGRLFSAYNVDGKKVWIITEHDRSATTTLLPDEY